MTDWQNTVRSRVIIYILCIYSIFVCIHISIYVCMYICIVSSRLINMFDIHIVNFRCSFLGPSTSPLSEVNTWTIVWRTHSQFACLAMKPPLNIIIFIASVVLGKIQNGHRPLIVLLNLLSWFIFMHLVYLMLFPLEPDSSFFLEFHGLGASRGKTEYMPSLPCPEKDQTIYIQACTGKSCEDSENCQVPSLIQNQNFHLFDPQTTYISV